MNTTTLIAPQRIRLQAVTLDLYSSIHKAIRSELFSVTTAAGFVDATDELDVAALTAHLGSVARLLDEHAQHEDVHVQPVLVAHMPALAEQIETDHARFEARMAEAVAIGEAVRSCTASERRQAVHELYIELGAFVSGYLAHQDLEERVVMPAIEKAIGVDAVVGIHMAIIGSIPPEEMTRTLAVMLPALNVDDRTELLGGMRAGAPAEVFEGVWGLVRSVLPASELTKVATRLGLSS
jgi:Hemerythrin HHE cation binding domain